MQLKGSHLTPDLRRMPGTWSRARWIYSGEFDLFCAIYMEEIHGSISYFVADLRSFDDENFRVERRIQKLSTEDPYTQTQYDEDLEAQHDPNNRVYCICISDFFTDRNNLVYYIKGTQNVSMFSLGMTGMEAFNGSVLFIIGPYNLSHVFDPWNIDKCSKVQRVVKRNTPFKWRYIFETGRLVWSKSDVDLEKLEELMEKKSAQRGSRISSNLGGHGGQIGKPRLPLGGSGSLGRMADTTLQSRGTGKKRRDDSCGPGDKAKENEKSKPPHSGRFIEGPDGLLFDGQTEQDRRHFAVFTKKLSGTLDDFWTFLKELIREDPNEHNLKAQILPILSREKELARCRAETSDIMRNTDRLSQLETGIRVDKTRVFQNLANIEAERWKYNCAKMLRANLRESKSRDSRREFKSFMDALMLWDNDTSQVSKMDLEEHEIQASIDLAENHELQKDCMDKIEAADSESDRFYALHKIQFSLEEEETAHISKLIPGLFDRFGHINLEDPKFLATTKLNEHGLTVHQEKILVNMMEAINTSDRCLATMLLEESHWVAHVALERWWDRDIPLADWTAKELGKRSLQAVVMEKGESSKKETTRSGARPGWIEEEPEESLEEARARLDRIIAGTQEGG